MPSCTALTWLLGEVLFQEAHESLGQGGDLFGRAFVLELACGIEGFVGLGQGDLIRQDDDADVAKHGPQMDETAQTAERAGRSTEERGRFAAIGGERGFVVGLAAGGPVEGVLEHAGDGAVVFRGGDEEGVVVAEEGLQFFGVVGQAVLGLEISIEQRQREITQIEKGDFGTGGTCRIGSDADELLVEGAGARAARESEDFGWVHVRWHTPARSHWRWKL